jgi:AcrR family transcriptional regulator/DNA-binding MarR family transcriptional regulator
LSSRRSGSQGRPARGSDRGAGRDGAGSVGRRGVERVAGPDVDRAGGRGDVGSTGGRDVGRAAGADVDRVRGRGGVGSTGGRGGGRAAGVDVDRSGRRGGVAEIQRMRMISALTEVARERAAGGVTVAHVVARSGVSRRTFYELFEDRDDCFLAALDLAVQRAGQRVVAVYDTGGAWRERIRAGLGALLEFLDDEPGLGALCVVDALAVGPRALERRAQVVSVLIDAVDAGRGETKGSARPTRLTAEGVVGAVLAVLHARLTARDRGTSRGKGSGVGASRQRDSMEPGSDVESTAPSAGGQSMAALLGPLMGMIVLPYQGQAIAAREAARPTPQRRRASSVQGDPLRELHMRLTYRTVRVLLAIAAHPGASNRQVADASGVSDQGQISKLLARLEHLDLIDNNGLGAARGEPNVWSLTPRGKAVEHTVRRQTTPAGS